MHDILSVYKGTYDAWGNHAIICSDEQKALANLNPFRYRSYYYDTETDLYYLKSRYYDPEVGRFISIDGIEYVDPETINGLNLYAYCGNNHVMNVDPNGTFFLSGFLIGLAIAAGIGAAIGAASYVVSEVVSYVAAGEWSWSWGMFIGSIVGGAIGGALAFVAPKLSLVCGAMITGGISTALGMGLEKAFGEKNHSFGDIFVSSLFYAVISGTFAGITKFIKIPGFTGRGSISQVARQISTKFYNGTIKNITIKTFGKMFLYQAAYSFFSTIANGFLDAIGD